MSEPRGAPCSLSATTSRDMKHRAPAPPEQPVGPLTEPAPDLGVQALALPRGHRDVAGEGVEQPDVALRVVDDLPVVLVNAHNVEKPRRLDLASEVGQLARPRAGGIRREPLPNLVVDILELAEDGVAAVGKHMRRRPERQVPAGPKKVERLAVANAGIDPVPGRRRDDQIERHGIRRTPRFERRVHHLDIRILGEGGPRAGHEPGPELDARDSKPTVGERSRRLAGSAPDLEHAIAAPHARVTYEIVEELHRIVGPSPFVAFCGGVEGHAICHAVEGIPPANEAVAVDRLGAVALIPLLQGLEIIQVAVVVRDLEAYIQNQLGMILEVIEPPTGLGEPTRRL